MLEEAALESETPCRGFHGGMLTDNGASIHPARYLAGLARLALAAGADVHPHTQVTSIEPLGDRLARPHVARRPHSR